MVSFILDPVTQLVTTDDQSPTTSVRWDRATQEAIINTAVGPTITTRALALVHTAMYDAWAAYDATAISTQQGDTLQRPASENTDANKAQAMSFAAYRVLVELFPSQVSIFNALMAELGYDTSNASTDTSTPEGIGNVSAEALMTVRRNDGSNQLGTDPNGTAGVPYSDISGYTPFNPVGDSIDISRWTPERVPIDATPGTEIRQQSFLTPHWGNVTPFGLTSGSQFRPVAPEPFLLVDGTVNVSTGTITLADNSVVAISPSIVGSIINPAFIEQAETVVSTSATLTDEQKLIAEFWEDGGGTSFPPGTWMTFGQFVSARDNHSLDQDAQLFFMLANAEFDASIATWEAKAFYDYTRPVRAIRELGTLGLIGEFNASLGGFAIEAWAGPGLGTQTILATDFLTYQTPGGDPSPPFAEYVSGHSTFSAAGATILELFSGSDTFGGSVSFNTGESRFEPGVTPQSPLTLAWDRFSVAADEGGISRIYGGIHFEDGDFNGRSLGQDVAASAFSQALFYINGGVAQNVSVGTRNADSLVGTENQDQLYGRSGRDRLLGGDNSDMLYGGDGNDILRGDRGSEESGRDSLWGGNGGDRLFGGNGADTLMGDAGRDRLRGERGNDALFGGDDNDRLFGNQGDDQLRGEQGDDQI
ncbi:MAG: calcium-binding protein, partial [Symploca sp. SIO2B6]|nr:calcium-binding protein [Symploca sp. SIO2B6]